MSLKSLDAVPADAPLPPPPPPAPGAGAGGEPTAVTGSPTTPQQFNPLGGTGPLSGGGDRDDTGGGSRSSEDKRGTPTHPNTLCLQQGDEDVGKAKKSLSSGSDGAGAGASAGAGGFIKTSALDHQHSSTSNTATPARPASASAHSPTTTSILVHSSSPNRRSRAEVVVVPDNAEDIKGNNDVEDGKNAAADHHVAAGLARPRRRSSAGSGSGSGGRRAAAPATGAGRGGSSPQREQSATAVNLSSARRTKITGIYAGDLIPGQYIRPLTGTRRGEELYSRPDLERPWRSTQQQRHAMQVAHKEEEIEALMRLCSDLRTELGNVRSDAREMEFAVQERAKRQIAAREEALEAQRKELADARAALARSKEDTEHQIRLLQAQHENERHQLTTEVRLANEKMVEQAKAFDQQTREIKEVAAREVELMETRFRVRVEELEAELKAQRASATAAQAHYNEQMTHTKALLSKVEAEFRERARSAEQKSEEMRQTFDRAIEREREEKRVAQGEVRVAAEKLAAAMVDAEEVLHRYQLWNQFIVSALDAHQARFAEMCPEHVVEVNDPRQHDLPGLYTPRVLQQQPEAKLTVERIVLRLLELELNPVFPEDAGNQRNKAGLGDGHGVAEAEAQHIADRQQRLRTGMRELEERCRDLERVVSALRTRLCFFSDDLHQSLSVHYPQVEPPPPNKTTFVCLSIYEGNQLWTTQPELMHTAVSFFLSTLRSKKREYGAYECYADGVCVLLACEDPIAACRLALDIQEWCLKLPWPEGLRRHPACCPLYSPSAAVDAGARAPLSPASSSTLGLPIDGGQQQQQQQQLLFDGLRIAAAIHTGPCQLETTAMPESRYLGGGTRGPGIISTMEGGEVMFSSSSSPPSPGVGGAPTTTTTTTWGSAVPPNATTTTTTTTSSSAYRQHFYGRAVLQTIHIASLAQGGQIMVSQPVWNGVAQSRRHELSAMAVSRSLGRYAILSLNVQLGQEESQTMELFQLLPTALAGRQFVPTSLLLQQANRHRRGGAGGALAASAQDDAVIFKNGLVTGLEKVKNFTIAVAVAGLDHQHGAVQEGLQLLRTELREVQDKSAAMLEKARKAKAHFHLLPPPEMVLQLNELYHILEEVAGLSEESTEDMKQLEVAQDEIRASMQGVREYLYRYLSDTDRESALKVEHEATLNRLDGMLREVQSQRKREIDALQLAVGERDQALRRFYQQQQQQLLSGSTTGAAASLRGPVNSPPPSDRATGRGGAAASNSHNNFSLPLSSMTTRQSGGTPKLNTPANRTTSGSHASTARY